MEGRSSRLGGVVVTALVVLAVLVDARAPSSAADLAYLSVLVGAAVAAWIGVVRAAPGARTVPALIAAGVSSTALGDAVWGVLDAAGMGTDVSLADPAWFASYVFLVAALLVVLAQSRSGPRVDLGFVLDAVTIVVVCLLVFWRTSVDAIVEDESLPALVRVVWSAYPVMDAVLLALVLRVLLSRRARAAIDVWFAVGVGLWLAADVAYLQSPQNEIVLVLMDAAWMIAPVLMARATFRVRDVRTVDAEDLRAGWVAQMLIVVCPLLIPPALELVADLRGEPDQTLQLFVGTALVMTLAFVRTGLLVRSEQRAQAEMARARDAALAASEAKTVFLANISHEIRTPLTTMLATAEMLEDRVTGQVEHRLLEKLRRSGSQLRALVESILDFSRLQSGKADLERREFDLLELVDDIVEAHRPRTVERRICFDTELDPDLRRVVLGDRTRVFQVISNLVDNATKFTSEGRVGLVVEPVDEDLVQFTVTDTGIGIPGEDQDAVFDSFHQVDGSTTRRFGGSGLGLAICRELTDLMGGTIAVESRVGEGSTFRVRLPLPSAPAPR